MILNHKKTVYAEIPIHQLIDFENSPFLVINDAEMQSLTSNVRQYGITSPIIVREIDEDSYEIVSGHRRKRACEQVGINVIPAYIYELSEEEAIIMMVDSNLGVRKLTISEIAWACHMKLEAIESLKEQGVHVDIHHDDNIKEFRTEQYAQLTNLIDPLMRYVDAQAIKLKTALELSYLKHMEQQYVLNAMERNVVNPSMDQAHKLRELSECGCLSSGIVERIISEPKPNQKPRLHLSLDRIKPYMPEQLPESKYEAYIMRLLEREHIRYGKLKK